ncbi:sensor histidine kinase [Blautia producta]|uniref:sensor histidine kinase n=1 Tax=Blautia producta TaxID=33035 RepID=UPI0031B5C9A9
MEWFWNLIQLFLGTFELCICYGFLNLFMEKKYGEKIIKSLLIIFIIIFSFLINFNRQISGYSYALIIVLIILIGVLANIIYKDKVGRIFSAVALFYFTLTMLDLFCVYSCGVLLQQPGIGISVSAFIDAERILTLLIARIIMFILYLLLKKKKEMHNLFSHENTKIINGIIVFEAIGVYVFQYVYGYNYTSAIVSGWYLFFLIIIFMISVFITYILYRRQQEEINYAKLRTELLEYNYNNIYDGYINSEKIYHDMKNHIIIISQYIMQDEKEKALKYIECIKGPILYLDNSEWSGIKVIDFVLNYKLMEAEKEKIQIKYEVDTITNKEFLIQDHELCALLSNLLDNAIEASKLVEEDKREINVSIRYINNMLMIKTINNISTPPLEKAGRFITKKKNKEKHGIGLNSIQNVVSKYEGCMETVYDEKQFCVNLTLFC